MDKEVETKQVDSIQKENKVQEQKGEENLETTNDDVQTTQFTLVGSIRSVLGRFFHSNSSK